MPGSGHFVVSFDRGGQLWGEIPDDTVCSDARTGIFFSSGRFTITGGSGRFEGLHRFVSVQRSHKDHQAHVCLRFIHDSLLSGMSCVHVPVNGGDCSAVQAPMTVVFRHFGTSSVDR